MSADHRPKDALTVLARLALRRPEQAGKLRLALENRLGRLAEPALEVAVETGGPIAEVLADTLAETDKDELFRRFYEALPTASRSLRRVKAILYGWRAREPDLSDTEHASRQAQYADGLIVVERYSEAERVAREALATARQIDGSPDEPVGKALLTLAMVLTHQRRTAEAHEAYEEAESRLQRTTHHARALLSLGNSLSDLRRDDDALAKTEHAVQQLRQTGMMPATAAALLSFSNRLRESGRHQGSVDAAQEAVDILTPLADRSPDEFGLQLANACNSLGCALSECGEIDRAVTAHTEARQTLIHLRDDRGLDVDATLVLVLMNLAELSAQRGDSDQAVAIALEAAGISGRRADEDPVNLPAHVQTLALLTSCFGRSGRIGDAVDTIQEALRACDQLSGEAAEWSLEQVFDPVARAFRNYRASNAHKKAVILGSQAVYACRRLTALEAPGSIKRQAQICVELADSFSVIGRNDQASQAASEALALFHRFNDSGVPEDLLEVFALVLAVAAQKLSTLGDHESALPLVEHSIDLFGALVQSAPRLRINHIDALLCAARLRHELGKVEQARAAAAQARDLLRDCEGDIGQLLSLIDEAERLLHHPEAPP